MERTRKFEKSQKSGLGSRNQWRWGVSKFAACFRCATLPQQKCSLIAFTAAEALECSTNARRICDG
jgi:hypothetical protein